MRITEAVGAWLGPISSATPGGGGLFLYLFCVYFLGAIVWRALQERARTTQFRQLAEKWKFNYLGASVPGIVPCRRSEACRFIHSIRRTLVAPPAGETSKDLVLFDCTVGYGRRRRHRTVVAARSGPYDFGWSLFGPEVATEEVGQWTLVYGSTRFLSIGELDSLASQFSAAAERDH